MEKKMGVVFDGRMRVFCLVLTAFAATAARAEVQIGRLYDVVVVGGGPAGIGAALSAAKVGAKTALVERDSVVGGTTVQAKVCDMGLFSAWKRQIVDATGNATVAALAGARREKSPDDLRQPGSFFFWISSKGAKFDAAAVDRAFRKAIADGELLPTDVHVGMAYFIRKGGGSGCYVPLGDIKAKLSEIGHIVPVR